MIVPDDAKILEALSGSMTVWFVAGLAGRLVSTASVMGRRRQLNVRVICCVK